MATTVNNQPATAIDVIIPVYNGAAFVAEAVSTVQNQTHTNLRLIIANDGSTDNSWVVIEQLAQRFGNIVALNLPHRGITATLNSALQQSSAAWLAFLDCDDLWAPEKLHKQLSYLQAHPEFSLCFSLVQEFDHPGNQTTHRARREPLNGVFKSALLCRRSVFDQVGSFDESIQMGDFIDWYGRCKSAGLTDTILPEALTQRRVHGNNMSSSATAKSYLSSLRTHLQKQRASQHGK